MNFPDMCALLNIALNVILITRLSFLWTDISNGNESGETSSKYENELKNSTTRKTTKAERVYQGSFEEDIAPRSYNVKD